ncbi:hypothetical protein [Patulibacter sp. SYSU D01012]|uniref:hypothetical protein n=1 Tax=Patulibacter sp. SYSU D01012 TaxID=2817381 RepID=UPI001B309653|nr:hypothetical protein [Patulibacter sp. SYSU D01012]
MLLAAIPGDLWREYVQEPGRQGIFLVLAAFLGSFLFIRTSARMARSDRFPWWPGSVVTDSGVHLHHLVWGIVLMMGGGTLGFALQGQSGWFEVSAVLFGIGVGLTFDEFALWVYLQDVYWAREGRTSIDAVAITAAFMGLVFLGINPLQVTGDDLLATLVSLGYSLGVLLVSGVCFAKSRYLHGFGTLVFPPVGLWAVVRLARPGSPWARWRYGARDPERQRRADERFGPHRLATRITERLRSAIGGFPIELPHRSPAPHGPDRGEDEALEAAAREVQQRAADEAAARAQQGPAAGRRP